MKIPGLKNSLLKKVKIVKENRVAKHLSNPKKRASSMMAGLFSKHRE
jgi:hypothetical protein